MCIVIFTIGLSYNPNFKTEKLNTSGVWDLCIGFGLGFFSWFFFFSVQIGTTP